MNVFCVFSRDYMADDVPASLYKICSDQIHAAEEVLKLNELSDDWTIYYYDEWDVK